MGNAADMRYEAYDTALNELEENSGLTRAFIEENKIIEYSSFNGTEIYDVESSYNIQKLGAENEILYVKYGSDIENLLNNLHSFPNLKLIEYESIYFDDLEKYIEYGYEQKFKVKTLVMNLESNYVYLNEFEERIEFSRIDFIWKKTIINSVYGDRVDVLNISKITSEPVEKMKQIISNIEIVIEIKKINAIKVVNVVDNNRFELNLVWKLVNMWIDVSEIQELDLSNLNIRKLEIENTVKQNEITKLLIDNNNFQSLEQIQEELPSLKILSCLSNPLKSIQKIDFLKLKELNLSYDVVTGKQEIDLSHLKELEYLRIHGKCITDIIIHEDCSLKMLDISNTEICKLPCNKYPEVLMFNNTPIVNNEKLIIEIRQQNISYSCLPRIIFDNNFDYHQLPNFAYFKDKNVDNQKMVECRDNILNTLKYSNSLFGEYSTNLNEQYISGNRYSWIAIDGKWGNGKSYFFKNYVMDELETQNYKVVTLSSISLLTKNTYMSIINTLGYSESVFCLLNRMIKKNKEFIELLMKTYILIILILALLFIVNITMYNGSINDLITYLSVTISLTLIPSMYFFTGSDSQQDEFQKDIQSEVNSFLKKESINNEIVLVIDDIERCQVETQIQLLNTLAMLNENIHIILIADLKELKSALSNNYSSDTEYTALMSKYIDVVIDFDKELKIQKFDYFEEKYYFKDEELKRNVKIIIDGSQVFDDMSIREMDQCLLNIIGNKDYITSENTNFFYESLVNTISEAKLVGDEIGEVITFFEMYSLLFDKYEDKWNSVIRYSKYTYDELLVYAYRYDKGNFKNLLSTENNNEVLISALYESHIKYNEDCVLFYIEQFVDRYINEEFGIKLWKEIISKKEEEEEEEEREVNYNIYKPNRGGMIWFIKNYNIEKQINPRIL